MLKTLKTNSVSIIVWFLLVWILFPLGFSLGMFLSRYFDEYHNGFAPFVTTFLILVGLFIGLGEWLALRTRFKVLWTWIPATAIGLSFGCVLTYFVIVALFSFNDETLALTASLMVAGMLTGVLQWYSLELVEQVSWMWSLVSGLAFAISFRLSDLIALSLSISWIEDDVLFIVFMGFFLGLFSSIPSGLLILRPKYRES